MKKKVMQKLNKSKVISEGLTFANAMSKRNLATNAASIAFYLFISLIPMFVLLCSELPFTGISRAELTKAITDITPQSVKSLISSMISQAYSVRIGVFSVSIIILVWSSSKGMLALIRSLDMIYEEKDSRSFFAMVCFSVFYTMCLLLGISLLLVLYTKGRSAEEVIRATFHNETIFEKLEKHSRDFNILAILTLLFATVYKIAPAGKRKFIYQIPGALFSAIAIAVFSVYFAAYSNGSNIYNLFYGSLTSVTIFLMWIYSCINLFLIGGVINSHYQYKIEDTVIKIKNSHFKRKIKRKDKRNKRKNKQQ